LTAVIDSILLRKENGCGKLIFCHFREEIDEIATRLRNGGMTKVATFDGRTGNGKRYDILNDKNEALILQIQTGCEGLNLQENYSEIYFISPHWNPAIEEQAIARCHRIGQTKPVYVQRFEMSSFISDDAEISTRTIDKYVGDIQECKRIVASEIIV
jgi:SNF2 family DNA or RNA helicase